MTNTQREWKERFQERFDKDTVPYESENGIVLDEFFVMADLDELTDFIQKEIDAARAEGAAAERERILDVILEKKRLLDEARTLHLNEGRIMLAYDMDSRFYALKHLLEDLTPTKDKGEDVSSNDTV